MLIRELFDFYPKPSRPASFGKKEGKYPFFTSSNSIDKYVDVADYDGEYLIIGDGGTANCKYYLGKFSASDHNYILKPLDGTNCKLVRYFFMQDNYKTLSEGFKGVGIKNISKTYIQNIEFSKNNSYTDDKIVGTLSNIELIIDSKMKELSYLNELIKSRFVEMFGNPIVNPMGWQVAEFSNYITFLTSGSRGWAKYFSDDGEYFITIKNVKNCGITLDDVQHVVPPNNAEAQRTRVKEEDLLISITADLGRTGVVTKEIADYGAYINQHLTCVRLDRSRIRPLYAAYYLESNAGKDQFQSKNRNGVKAGLNFDAIKSLKLLVPPVEVQDEFLTFVGQIDKLKFSVHKEIDLYKELLEKKMNEYFG